MTQNGMAIGKPTSLTPNRITTKSRPKSKTFLDQDNLNQDSNESSRFKEWVENSSSNLVALVGYSLLGLALVDFGDTLLPPRLFDQNWQYQTIALVAGKVWAPLLGMLLVFFRRGHKLRRAEVRLLSFLSWLCLVISIAYFLLIPLAINNAFRIDHRNNTQANAQVLQQSADITTMQEQVLAAKTPQEIGALYATVNRLPGIPQLENPQATRQQMLDALAQTDASIQVNSEANIKIAQRGLIKNTLRVVLTTAIAGFAFLGIWQQSKWVRQYRSTRKSSEVGRLL